MRKERKLSFGRFIFELFIVFIGVYGAFELNRYQEAQREQKIREKYFVTFRSELIKLIGSIRSADKAAIEELEEIKNYNDSLKNQAFYPKTIIFNESLLITQAGLNADVFVQLSPDLAASLIGGFDYVKSLELLINDFNGITKDRLYGLKWGDLFDRNNHLKSEFLWYQNQLELISDNLVRVGNMMEYQAGPFVDQIIADF